jgi:hypothetical protein
MMTKEGKDTLRLTVKEREKENIFPLFPVFLWRIEAALDYLFISRSLPSNASTYRSIVSIGICVVIAMKIWKWRERVVAHLNFKPGRSMAGDRIASQDNRYNTPYTSYSFYVCSHVVTGFQFEPVLERAHTKCFSFYLSPPLSFFWGITLCTPLEIDERFRGLCCLHHQDRISRARYQRERRWQACRLLSRPRFVLLFGPWGWRR